MESEPLPVLPTVWRLLTFKITREEMLRLDNRFLLFGLLSVWGVGMGRSWDDPKAEILQHLGVGSLAYVFAMTLILWLVARPLVMDNLTYKQVFLFVSLVSPPAIIYAIPVEKFLDAGAARAANTTFLGIVATWRVALLVFYLNRLLDLPRKHAVIAALTLLVVIAAPLTVLQVFSDIMEAMGGFRDGKFVGGTPDHDPVKNFFLLLGGISILAFLPLLVAHSYLSSQCPVERREQLTESTETHREP